MSYTELRVLWLSVIAGSFIIAFDIIVIHRAACILAVTAGSFIIAFDIISVTHRAACILADCHSWVIYYSF